MLDIDDLINWLTRWSWGFVCVEVYVVAAVAVVVDAVVADVVAAVTAAAAAVAAVVAAVLRRFTIKYWNLLFQHLSKELLGKKDSCQLDNWN